MSKCQSKSRATECSTEPEIFAVTTKSGKTTTTQCLAHAILAEAAGQHTELILS